MCRFFFLFCLCVFVLVVRESSRSAREPRPRGRDDSRLTIRGWRAVAFDYSGVSRVAHPHRLGPSVAKNGKVLARCWEVSLGGEATGTWKLFDVGKASAPRLLPGTFEPAPGYTPRDRAIPAPEAEVAAAPSAR